MKTDTVKRWLLDNCYKCDSFTSCNEGWKLNRNKDLTDVERASVGNESKCKKFKYKIFRL